MVQRSATISKNAHLAHHSEADQANLRDSHPVRKVQSDQQSGIKLASDREGRPTYPGAAELALTTTDEERLLTEVEGVTGLVPMRRGDAAALMELRLVSTCVDRV